MSKVITVRVCVDPEDHKFHKKDEADENDQDFVETTPSICLDEPDENDSIMKWAKSNINEDPDFKIQIIEEFRNMIFEKGECDPDRTDDAYLLRFLRARHFIIRMAHRLIVNHENFKKSYPEFFTDLDYMKIWDIGETEIFSIPPYVDKEGRRMLIVRFGKWDPSQFTTDELFQSIIMMIQIASLEPKFQILGGVCIIDAADIGTGQAWYLTPTIIKHILSVAYGAFPHRVHALHIINASKIFDYAFGMIRPFLSVIMKQRIFIHSNFDSLHKHIEPKYLPKRYGGIHKDYFYRDWLSELKNCDPLIEELELYGYEGCREFIENI
ncbi:alpha-tocopherol transfer protein-like [Sitophilus oryzae]|uniref:Alpha-tocopherol transfer protein-like n=1 Tax=Sitophilus oryzae TaxID=7048 RepID=A0A6J2YCK6_SITOR|nr:alpha-tocopherol transfer protein-like [Sitophilus oryzae]XP_030761153.1 alpha-tocopherol transfer protein-like [Sitophilus oryzae]